MNKLELDYIRVKANKQRAINYMGGKCDNCKCDNFICLEFHHSDNKDYDISSLLKGSWKNVENELEKCILLCANCHAEIHFNGKNAKDDRCLNNKKVFLEAINKFKCDRCEYNKCYGGLDFHHKDKNNKNFNLGSINKRFSTIEDLTDICLNELNYCDVLCKNCHRIEHFGKDNYNKYKDKIIEKVNNFRMNNYNPDINLIIKLHNEGKKWEEIKQIANVSKATISKYLKMED